REQLPEHGLDQLVCFTMCARRMLCAGDEFPEGQIMGFSTKNVMAGLLAVAAVSSAFCMPAEAYYNGYVGHSKTNAVRSYFYRHPKVKAATVGAGIGTAAGAATGLISGRGIMRGALIGAGAGTGVGLLR